MFWVFKFCVIGYIELRVKIVWKVVIFKLFLDLFEIIEVILFIN